MGRLFRYWLVVFFIAVAPPAFAQGGDVKLTPLCVYSKEGVMRAKYNVELATTSETRAQGLMHRTELAEDRGMLFIFFDDRVRSFWMKNTLIPLDMIFMNARGEIVTIVTEAKPLDLTPRGGDVPVRYVLEVAGGVAEKVGIKLGDRISHIRIENGLPKCTNE